MKYNTTILNVQDYREGRIDYLQHWDINAHSSLRCCPLCERSIDRINNKSWYHVVRRTLRSMTIKCKSCSFQLTFTYHNLRKGMGGLANAAIAEGTNSQETVKKWQDDAEAEKTWDLEKRGRIGSV